jgi:hypothetical protein
MSKDSNKPVAEETVTRRNSSSDATVVLSRASVTHSTVLLPGADQGATDATAILPAKTSDGANSTNPNGSSGVDIAPAGNDDVTVIASADNDDATVISSPGNGNLTVTRPAGDDATTLVSDSIDDDRTIINGPNPEGIRRQVDC